MDKINLKIRKQLQYATVSLRGYRSLAKVSRKSMTRFVFVFLLGIWMISSVIPFVIGQFQDENLTNLFQKQIPEFSYQDGTLSSEVFYYIDEDYTVIVDTSRSISEMKDSIASETEYTALFGSESCSIKWKDTAYEIPYDKWIHHNYSKQILIQKVPMLYCIYAGFLILVYFASVGFFYLAGLLYGLFAFLFNLALQKKMGYWQCYRIGIYSIVTYSIIDSIVKLIGKEIPSFYVGHTKLNLIMIVLLLFYQIIGVSVQNLSDSEVSEVEPEAFEPEPVASEPVASVPEPVVDEIKLETEENSSTEEAKNENN